MFIALSLKSLLDSQTLHNEHQFEYLQGHRINISADQDPKINSEISELFMSLIFAPTTHGGVFVAGVWVAKRVQCL